MSKFVAYDEPFYCEYTGKMFNKEIRVSVEDAIDWQMGHAFMLNGHIYLDNSEALEDFLTIHWGRIINV